MSTSVEPHRRSRTGRTRIGTVVWGLIAVVIGLAFLITRLTDVEIDPVVVLLVVLVGSGLVLVAAGLMAAARGRNSDTAEKNVTTPDKEGSL